MVTRREFLDTMIVGAAGLAVASTAKSYAQIVGSNERVNFAIIGLNGRGYAHLSSLQANKDTASIAYVCDVDGAILAKFAAAAQKETGQSPTSENDFRRILEQKNVDAITIATPEHWHAPMAIAALQSGKHVYVEKPCSHNPAEGEMLVAAQRKYGKLVQMGTQQRSSPHTVEIVAKIHDGIIGQPKFGKAWYVNTRKSIGIGKEVPVPPQLDWDLWQGPAPRQAYKDNVHPYNWHWFRTWGTGETLNNGTHEVDVCRWAMGRGLSEARHLIGRSLLLQRRLAVLRHAGHQLRIRRRHDFLGREELPGHEVLRSRPWIYRSWERTVRFSSIATATRSTT